MASKKLAHKSAVVVVFLALLTLTPTISHASYAIYVGKNLTDDGSVLIGGSGDEVSSHWLEVVPADRFPAGTTIKVGVDETANMPGKYIQIPQALRTFRYLTMNYSDYEGFPPPITNGGLNENNVAGRDVWSPSRPELIAMTPNPQTGPSYSDLSRIAMERARSAREAVEIVGKLIDEYGYSTYGGNSHMFADENEGWVLINFAGGKGLWIAQRLGPDEIRVSYPGDIGNIPLNFQEDPNYMGSQNFIEFAVEQGWFDPDAGEPFNVTAVYGEDFAQYPRDELEQELRQSAPISLRQMLDAVRDPRLSKDTTGYGQVAHLRAGVRPENRTLWVAATGSITTPFVPYRIGVQSIPMEFGKHRYLTKGEATRFVTPDWQIQEATEFAGRSFKRLMYFTCDHPEKFLPEVTEALTAFEDQLIADTVSVEQTSNALFDSGHEELALKYLTEYSDKAASSALALGNALLGSIEARTRLLFGLRSPETNELSRLDYDNGIVKCE
ncbi:peptidase U34, dipeptidase [Luminiphilus syltensis NOR5-1B]|uniref:Dipeptidase n=1 Tax=Luminiphilus syltensis NOR5-1B TaxID=565045 RepID=B8KVN2_9GAMM|nr:C69 family dipeptidase [Luminiphilus syltensis]EED34207.1 peptidase U34, dipeptidase [Luminiphilus syltensis NOR5-1B]